MAASSGSGGGFGVAIFVTTIGGVMVYSALKGIGITDVLAGKEGDKLDPHGSPGGLTGTGIGVSPTGTSSGIGPATSLGALPMSSPQAIIDKIVIPMAQKAGINVTPGSVAAANARHGPTISGDRSDHQGPPNERWAADMSNGTSPTPQMDALAAALAKTFSIPWDGSGASSATHGGYRYQLIYRSWVGGNHFNHVHFGVARA